ncbi:MAG: hypothetical protein M3304_10570 [Actinomycetota bacterium]|nr:hypothetical protein [Actinomycetota bacterium]
MIPSISIPSRRATMAWPYSWRRRDTKNAIAATTAIAAYVPLARPGFVSGKIPL